MNTKKTTLRFVLLLFLLAPGFVSYGQSFEEQLVFHHITDRQGLSQRTVRTILQDSEGFIWMGTQDGLNKYDSYNMKIYRLDLQDPNSIPFDEIRDIFEDSRKNLWFGGWGLSRYNREKDHFYHYNFDYLNSADELWRSDTAINSLEEDNEGNLLIGSDIGLAVLDIDNKALTYKFVDPALGDTLSHSRITDIFKDTKGNIWVGTRNGLNVIHAETGSITHFLPEENNNDSISDSFIQSIYEDSKGYLWVGTLRGGVSRYDTETGIFTNFRHQLSDPASISDNSVLVILEDSRGSLWIGTENQGLNLFDRESETFIPISRNDRNLYSLNSNSIYSLFESDNSMLWIGTYSGGVNILDRTERMFEHYQHHAHIPTSLSDNVVTSFAEVPDGIIWIGTDGGGMNRFDRDKKSFTVMRHDPYNPQSIPSNVILDLTTDGKESIWIASYKSGFSRYNYITDKFDYYRHDPRDPNTPRHNAIFSLYLDPIDNNMLWVGTNGGIYRYNLTDGSYINYRNDPNDPTSLDQNDIRDFHRDRNGTLRIGNYGGSIVELNDETETFNMHSLQDGAFFNNVIQNIFESNANELWLASWGSGLIRFDRDSGDFKAYTERNGLPSNFVHGILEDNHGFLWLSSNNGLTRFDPQSETATNFGIEDGVQSQEFYPRSTLLDSKGYMYFGGINGFNRFHPDSLQHEKKHHPVVFTDFLIFNEPVPIGTEGSPLDNHIRLTEKIVLSHQSSVLTFSYASLNYNLNAVTQYAYKLEGFETSWNFVGDRRSATYTNLRPGQYRLRVKITDGGELVEGYEASVSLIITPPFWQTTWFYFIAGFSILLFVGLFYWFRVYNIAKQNKLLEEEVKKQTNRLHERNQTLEKTLNELNRTKDQLVEKAHKAGMADIATNVLHDVGNILNSVNVSTSVLNKTIDQCHLKNLQNANSLLRENMSTIEDFILNNPKGKVLLEYYLELDKPLANDYQTLKDQIKRLTEKINLIIDVVSAQQSFSTAKRIVERLSIDQVIDDTLAFRINSFSRHEITIKKDFQPVEAVNVEKIKLIHVLINVLKNAVDSIKIQNPETRLITIKLYQNNEQIFISIADTGAGFKQDQLPLLFKHGYTTKEKGMGFGLHSCANYMREMKGDITAKSEGPGKGAEFILSLPR